MHIIVHMIVALHPVCYHDCSVDLLCLNVIVVRRRCLPVLTGA